MCVAKALKTERNTYTKIGNNERIPILKIYKVFFIDQHLNEYRNNMF